MKIKELFLTLVFFSLLSVVSAYLVLKTSTSSSLQTIGAAVKQVDPSVVADGQVHSQNEAILHFQTGGKIVSLPFKEGDRVKAGQVIAQLDTYALQRQLTQSLNAYRSTRDNFDQAKTNQDKGLLQDTSQQTILNGSQTEFVQPKSLLGDSGYTYLNDVAKRIVDQNQANLDNSVINVELASNALQLATLTSPINGILTHEDGTVSSVNVTPTTTFVVADPSNLIFKANIPVSQIASVKEGSVVTIRLDGVNRDISGSVLKVYPQPQSLPNGDVYQVDVESEELQTYAKFGQSGSVLITSNTVADVTMVPTWAVLSHNYVWVLEGNKPVLKKVSVGKTHGSYTEVTGLTSSEKVILDPAGIAEKQYQLL